MPRLPLLSPHPHLQDVALEEFEALESQVLREVGNSRPLAAPASPTRKKAAVSMLGGAQWPSHRAPLVGTQPHLGGAADSLSVAQCPS